MEWSTSTQSHHAREWCACWALVVVTSIESKCPLRGWMTCSAQLENVNVLVAWRGVAVLGTEEVGIQAYAFSAACSKIALRATDEIRENAQLLPSWRVVCWKIYKPRCLAGVLLTSLSPESQHSKRHTYSAWRTEHQTHRDHGHVSVAQRLSRKSLDRNSTPTTACLARALEVRTQLLHEERRRVDTESLKRSEHVVCAHFPTSRWRLVQKERITSICLAQGFKHAHVPFHVKRATMSIRKATDEWHMSSSRNLESKSSSMEGL